MALIGSLYSPLRSAPLMETLGVFWLSIFDMLIADHEHTRHRDFCVVLGQTRRAMALAAARCAASPEGAPSPRPIVVVEHLYVPTDACAEPGGYGLAPMLRSLRQWLCAVSIDAGAADVLVLAPRGSAAGESAAVAWRSRGLRNSCAERATLGGGAVAIALTQSEAVDQWLGAMRLYGRNAARKAA